MAYPSVHTFCHLPVPQQVRTSLFSFYCTTGKSEAVGFESFLPPFAKGWANHSLFIVHLVSEVGRKVKWHLFQSTKLGMMWYATENCPTAILGPGT